MKKSLLAMLFAVALAVPALADGMWVGGTVGYDSTSLKDGGNTTTWSIVPEVGFNLNEKWDLGLDLGYASTNDAGAYLYRGINVPGVTNLKEMYGAAFARYNVFSIGGFSVLAKGSIGYSNAKFTTSGKDETLDTIFVAVVPVVSYSINDSWSIDAVLNFAELSYARTTGPDDAESNQFGFNLNDGSIANIGFSYHF